MRIKAEEIALSGNPEQSETRELFSNAVERHYTRIYRLCLFMTGNREDAEECTQETYIRVLRHISGLKEREKLKGWLTVTAANCCRSFLGKKRRRPESGIEIPEIASTEYSPETEADARETASQIRAAIQRLPRKHRILVILRDIENYSYEEIGGILGLNEGTVKSRLWRARSRLRSLIEDMGL